MEKKNKADMKKKVKKEPDVQHNKRFETLQ
jgi:hypothetical protein